LWGGTPAKEIRDLKETEREWIKELSDNYIKLSKDYLSNQL
jgi:carbonic anhydrase/acetyltransferase-like protein (isoleucine patch superfamily)